MATEAKQETIRTDTVTGWVMCPACGLWQPAAPVCRRCYEELTGETSPDATISLWTAR